MKNMVFQVYVDGNLYYETSVYEKAYMYVRDVFNRTHLPSKLVTVYK